MVSLCLLYVAIVRIKSSEFSIYRIVADNVDLEITSRIQSKEKSNRSLHWNHQFVLLDKVCPPYSKIGEDCAKKMQFIDLLPDMQVQQNLVGRMAILVSRVITNYLKAFQPLKNVVVHHIPHRYSEEMANKSDSVSSCF